MQNHKLHAQEGGNAGKFPRPNIKLARIKARLVISRPFCFMRYGFHIGIISKKGSMFQINSKFSEIKV